MTINVARITLRDSAKAADHLLADLRTGMDAVDGDIRRLVYGLRPPALDGLGLEGAIRALAGEGPPATRVTVSGDLAGLPSAVETAVYRIVQEALTNVRRHARAGAAEVEVTRTGTLRVRISDDGAGLPSVARAGVGTASMRERAAELGGTCAITSRPGGGTVVEALLPLPIDARHPA
jgi:signal transduction histidine kinase